MEEMANHAAGWVRMDFIVPSRGPHRIPDRLPHRNARYLGRSPTPSRRLPALGGRYPGAAIKRLAGVGPFRRDHGLRIDAAGRPRAVLRGTGDGDLRGHGRGYQPRAEDLDVNVTRRRRRTCAPSTADVFETLAKAIELDLERAMEFCAPDECVEVTPEVIRVRKTELDAATSRARSRSRAKAAGRG